MTNQYKIEDVSGNEISCHLVHVGENFRRKISGLRFLCLEHHSVSPLMLGIHLQGFPVVPITAKLDVGGFCHRGC